MNKKIYTINEIKYMLNSYLKEKPVYNVVLFGSYAKGNATSYSDLDLVIDTKEELMGFKFYSLVSKLEELFGKEIDGFEKSEIIENERIDTEIKKTGVVVYER